LDRQRADAAGQALSPVLELATSTATGLARRMNGGQWAVVETGEHRPDAAAAAGRGGPAGSADLGVAAVSTT
jgi:hypothetical protein